MSLQQSFDAGQTWDMNSHQAQTIMKLISEMIVLNNQPLLISKDLGFMYLMKHLALRYHLPSQHHFSDTVIPNLVERAEAAVGKMLEKAKHFSFTSDIWTCSCTNDSFISLMAHLIDEQETKIPCQSIVLRSRFFPGSHTGQRIAVENQQYEVLFHSNVVAFLAYKCKLIQKFKNFTRLHIFYEFYNISEPNFSLFLI